VFRVLENNVFPRIVTLENGVSTILAKGCAQRPGDLRRTEEVESSVKRIFDKIDGFGECLANHRVDVTKQISGIRIWVLTGCVVVLIALLSFFAIDYANDLNKASGKPTIAITK
jgi:hypothetical protein